MGTTESSTHPNPSPSPDRSDGADELQTWLDRLAGGDPAAREALIAANLERFEHLTRKMLRTFPSVQRWDQTGDILNQAMMRLDAALREVSPASPADLFRLGATMIRRTLLDLARRYTREDGLHARHESHAPRVGVASSQALANRAEPAAPEHSHNPAELAEWTEFHAAVDDLEPLEKSVFELIFYQGRTQDEAAQILKLSTRTIKRHWQAARLKLHDALEGRLPGI